MAALILPLMNQPGGSSEPHAQIRRKKMHVVPHRSAARFAHTRYWLADAMPGHDQGGPVSNGCAAHQQISGDSDTSAAPRRARSETGSAHPVAPASPAHCSLLSPRHRAADTGDREYRCLREISAQVEIAA